MAFENLFFFFFVQSWSLDGGNLEVFKKLGEWGWKDFCLGKLFTEFE